MGECAIVSSTKRRAKVELWDLDERPTVEEIPTALNRGVQAKVFDPEPNSLGQKMASVSVAVADVEALLQQGRLKFGRVSCRMQSKLLVPRCFNCLVFGHVAAKNPKESVHV